MLLESGLKDHFWTILKVVSYQRNTERRNNLVLTGKVLHRRRVIIWVGFNPLLSGNPKRGT